MSTRWYKYNYDALNRITSGIIGSSNPSWNNKHNLKLVEYDKNGNITKLGRNGYLTNGTFTDYLDDLTYTYDVGNSLIDILEEGNKNGGFSDALSTQTGDYVYDANGNMVKDLNKEIGTSDVNGITNNYLNLPKEVKFSDSNTRKINYIYHATGNKLEKKVTEGSEITRTFYAGNHIYAKVDSRPDALKFFNHPEGYVSPVYGGSGKYQSIIGFDYVYQYKDHLGNTRLSYSDADGNGVINASTEILEENNYYPGGLKHKGYNSNINGVDHPYGFNGKEENDELGLGTLDFGARNYDPSIFRWFNIDPLAEKYSGASPYVYSANNPILFVDPDGKDVYISISNKPVGTTSIRLIGASGEAPRQVQIQVYEMNVTDDVTGTKSTYYVTRDAPVYKSENSANPIAEFFGLDETTYNVINTAFEPANGDGEYKAVALQYPAGTDLEALALRNEDGSANLDAEPNESPEREKGKKDEASGVMIHVGGTYQKDDGKTYSVGSFGCFGLCGKDAGNKGAKDFIKDIVNRRDKNKKAKKGTDINVTIQKRKNVDWEWEVDEEGNKSN